MSLRGLYPSSRISAVFLVGTAWARALFGADVPEPAPFRAAFEAEFPKSPPSGAALALEEVAAKLGLALAPRAFSDDGVLEKGLREKGRSEPTPDAAADQLRRGGFVGTYVSKEIASPRELVGAPRAELARYLEDSASEIDAARSILLGDSEVAWEVDVSQGRKAPFPNVIGVLRLERLLLARALLEISSGASLQALETVEASWRLNEALGSRPDLLSQIVAVAGARQHAGVLRKIDAPAFGWPERLRNGRVFAGVVAAFENEFWAIHPDATDLTGEEAAWGRTDQRIGEEFRRRSRCGWSGPVLEAVVKDALRAEGEDPEDRLNYTELPNLVNLLFRGARFEIEAEVTALVIEARIERAALRGRHWPDKLLTLATGVCSEDTWSYRVLRNGTIRIAFEGVPPEDNGATHTPLEFYAGSVRSSARRTPSRRRIRPAPVPHDRVTAPAAAEP